MPKWIARLLGRDNKENDDDSLSRRERQAQQQKREVERRLAILQMELDVLRRIR